MDTDLHLLQDLTVATSSSPDVGLSSNADRRRKVSGAHSTTPPFPRATGLQPPVMATRRPRKTALKAKDPPPGLRRL
jgi:hypothetical protein